MSAPDRPTREPAGVELPAPTAWPMALALGVTLIFGGLVTNAAVSAVGIALAAIAGVGWWRLMRQEHELQEHQTQAEALAPAEPAQPEA